MHYDKTGEFPWEVYRKAYDLGLVNPSVPTAYAGGGLSALECCLIVEELGAACAGITTSIMVNDLALMPILVGGSEEQQADLPHPVLLQLQYGGLLPDRAGGGL